ncbi:MAG: DUF4253 domain-containing protein [Myxococcales bacterium]
MLGDCAFQVALLVAGLLAVSGCTCNKPAPPVAAAPDAAPAEAAAAPAAPSSFQAASLLERVKAAAGDDFGFEATTKLDRPAISSRPLKAREALALWTKLDAQLGGEQIQPVVIEGDLLSSEYFTDGPSGSAPLDGGVRDVFARFEQQRAKERAELVASSEDPDLKKALAETFDQERTDYQSLESFTAEELAAGADPGGEFFFVGYPDVAASSEPETPSLRVLVLAGRPEEVPVALRFGGFNACPFPWEHALVLRSWRDRYDARLVFLGPDTLELSVRRPPSTPAEVKRVTREQFLYCEDIVVQGTGSVVALAQSLYKAPRWFFWWD